MGKRTNIGIYISPTDKDIAAWFNLLERNHQSRSRWIQGLLAAYSLNRPLRIGVVDKRAPLVQNGPDQGDTVPSSGHFAYGWHVRGPNREFVIGSVVNVSIRNDEIKTTLDEAWENGHKLAPFIKALIRQNLKVGDKDIPPKSDELNQVWSAYLVKVNSVKTKRKKAMELSKLAATPVPEDDLKPAKPKKRPKTEPEPEQEEDWTIDDPKPKLPREDTRFSFAEPGPEPTLAPDTPAPGLGKNPLLDQI